MRFFTQTEVKIIGLTVAAATAVAVVITVSVGLAKRHRIASAAAATVQIESELPYITDIVIPEEFTLTGGERWYFSREPQMRWSKEQIDMFWIDPAEIGIDLMNEKNDEIVRDFVEGLP